MKYVIIGCGAFLFQFNQESENNPYPVSWEYSSYLGHNATNNEAEYFGLIRALEGMSSL